MAAAYVNGLQSEGVSATIKHFVANDQEHERTAAESVMSERALREIYLYPYVALPLASRGDSDVGEQLHACTKACKAWGIYDRVGNIPVLSKPIISWSPDRYGRIGGLHCSENPTLLQVILRDEWKFNGIVMSDWYFIHLVADSAKSHPFHQGLALTVSLSL